jgi:hypothetical protein
MKSCCRALRRCAAINDMCASTSLRPCANVRRMRCWRRQKSRKQVAEFSCAHLRTKLAAGSPPMWPGWQTAASRSHLALKKRHVITGHAQCLCLGNAIVRQLSHLHLRSPIDGRRGAPKGKKQFSDFCLYVYLFASLYLFVCLFCLL